jgi:hypothetical protein
MTNPQLTLAEGVPSDRVVDVCFDPIMAYLVVALTKCLKIFDMKTGAARGTLELEERVTGIALDSYNPRVGMVATATGVVILVDIYSAQVTTKLQGSARVIRVGGALDQYVVVCSDGRVHLHYLNEGRCQTVATGLSEASCAVVLNEIVVVYSSAEGLIVVVRLSVPVSLLRVELLDIHGQAFLSGVGCTQAPQVVLASVDGSIRLSKSADCAERPLGNGFERRTSTKWGLGPPLILQIWVLAIFWPRS